MIRSVVVLPEPEGPSIVKNSPGWISSSIESTATTSPYVLRIPVSATSGAGTASADGTRRCACSCSTAIERTPIIL
jgi:hypothetical protein